MASASTTKETPAREEDPQDRDRRPTRQHEPSSSERLQPVDTSNEWKRRTSASSTDNMQRSASPTGSSNVKLTRTGRVSKATKGQRVHHCEDCGKTYTRNEHLRRHQQNHKPGAYPCDVPGCIRSFYREDLLARHKARHNDPGESPSRRHSLTSEASPGFEARTLPTVSPAASMLPPQSDAPASASRSPVPARASPGTAQQSEAQRPGERRSRKGYIPLHELEVTPCSITVDTRQPNFVPYYNQTQWEPSPPCSPDDPPDNMWVSHPVAASSSQQYLQPHWDASSLPFPCETGGLRSPVSASSVPAMPYWNAYGVDSMHGSTASSETSYGQQSQYHFGVTDQQRWMGDQSTLGIDPEQRDRIENGDLAIPVDGLSSIATSNGNDCPTDEQRYLDAYWDSVQPLWPVLHKRDLDVHAASPLLKASILALGAHSTGNRRDLQNGRILYDRCIKVLQKRTIRHWHTYRTCDVQAVLFIELYSLFNSRRPPLHLSSAFETAYEYLAADGVANPAILTFVMDPSLQPTQAFSDLEDCVEQESRRRLLAAYYLLDRQHAALFGRVISTKVSLLASSLAFPQPQECWESLQVQNLTEQDYPIDALHYGILFNEMEMAKSSSETSPQLHDTFASSFLLNGLLENVHMNTTAESVEEQGRCSARLSDHSSRARLAYHTTMLCKHAPIRDLLAVAGESWVMAEKMRSQADYSAAQLSVRTWACDFESKSTGAHFALCHALSIIKIHQSCSRTSLLFHDWALHLASIVVWTRAYTAIEPRRRPRLSIPSPSEPKVSSHELERTVRRVLDAGADAAIEWRDAKSILQWSKAKLEQANADRPCGLTSGALDVLGKLVLRGDEEGCWF